MTSDEFNQQIQQILQIGGNKEAFFKLCDLYMVSSEMQRKELHHTYFYERDWEAPDFLALAAHPLGEPDRETRFRASLICLALAPSEDFRDNLVIVAAIWNALKDSGKDADAWLRYFGEITFAEGASAMVDFASRRSDDKELEKWGYKRVITDSGITYEPSF